MFENVKLLLKNIKGYKEPTDDILKAQAKQAKQKYKEVLSKLKTLDNALKQKNGAKNVKYKFGNDDVYHIDIIVDNNTCIRIQGTEPQLVIKNDYYAIEQYEDKIIKATGYQNNESDYNFAVQTVEPIYNDKPYYIKKTFIHYQ